MGINELENTVTAYTRDSGRGSLTALQTISTLPADVKALPNYSTAEVLVHPTGRFLYGSNRGDSIAVFSIDQATGRLAFVETVATEGATPRGFGIDPSGAYLIAGNQRSDSVVVFRINPETGRLTPTGSKIAIGAPVSVKFVASLTLTRHFSQTIATRIVKIRQGRVGAPHSRRISNAERRDPGPSGSVLTTLMRDIPFSFRLLRKSPGFAAIALLALAIGVEREHSDLQRCLRHAPGAAALSGSRPAGDGLVAGPGGRSTAAGTFLEWKRQATVFEDLNAWTGGAVNLATADRPEQVDAVRATPGFYSMMGVPFVLGRDFRPEEGQPGADQVVVLRYRLWDERFGKDPTSSVAKYGSMASPASSSAFWQRCPQSIASPRNF